MKKTSFRVAALAAVAAIAAPAIASHSWNNYHWKRTDTQITPPLGDNVSSKWDAFLVEANNDWNASTVIQSNLTAGQSNPKNCKAVSGRIEVCNSRYGFNGWLGVAQIWLSGGHIVQGITKLNDSYFDTATYNKPEWRRMVTCQEIGHDYGLDHQDEAFDNANLGTCMDYTNSPLGPPSNEHPNAHDYDQLQAIYLHTDPTSFAVQSPGQSNASPGLNGAIGGDTPADWGRAVGYDGKGRPDTFVQELGSGKQKITHVFWAIGEGPRN